MNKIHQTRIHICAFSDVPTDDVIGVSVDSKEYAVYNVEGEIFITDDLCTHGNARLSEGFLDGNIIECPLHAGCFKVTDGSPCALPVDVPVATYPVIIEDAQVYLVKDT